MTTFFKTPRKKETVQQIGTYVDNIIKINTQSNLVSRMKFKLLLILLITQVALNAQTDPHYSHFMFNQAQFNPSSVGLQDEICATVTQRQQWMGIDGSPTTTALTVDAPISLFKTSSGIALSIYDDQLGFENNFNLKLSYSYQQIIGTGLLSAGFDVGFINKSLEGTWILPNYEGNGTGKDPAIPEEKEQAIALDLGVGAFYATGKFYAGISVAHINQPLVKFSNPELSFIKRQYYFTTGYTIPLVNSFLELKPSLFLTTDIASLQYVANINVVYNKKIWGGLSYRGNDALVAILGTSWFNNIGVSIAYDMTTSTMKYHTAGSVEILLKYCFNLDFSSKIKQNKSVRFL